MGFCFLSELCVAAMGVYVGGLGYLEPQQARIKALNASVSVSNVTRKLDFFLSTSLRSVVFLPLL